jgi:periplasmic protein TonB
MFEDSLIESAGVLKTKRRAATAASLLLQCMLVGVMAALPLLYTEALPKGGMPGLVALGTPPAAAAPAHSEVRRRPASPRNTDMVGRKLREPTAIPRHILQFKDEEPPVPVLAAEGGGVVGSPGPGSDSGVLNTLARLAPPVTVPQPSVRGPLRISQGVAQGILVHEVRPVYPPLARQARIQGTVVLQAIIGKNGSIENLQVVSGHPLLAPAAIAAVRQWRYRPYSLNGEPVEVETQITVNFVLGGGS